MAAKKKKTATKPYGNKTKFVLGLSRDLSAKQVVDEAKKNGITITEAHVYKIRSTAKTKGKAPKASKGRRGAQASGGNQSKREFVLSFGPDTAASEILRKAKEAGIGLSKAYLYTIRSAGGATKGRGARTVGAEAKAAFKRVRGAASSLEHQFVEAALDLGFAKATELLNRLRTRAKSY